MSYPRYFRQGQKIRLRPLAPAPAPVRDELLTCHLIRQTADSFEVRLPYGTSAQEQYPFADGMLFELSADAIGIGLRMTATVAQVLAPDLVRLQLNHDLQAVQRRLQPRVDVELELRFSRSHGNLRSMRDTWLKNVEVLENRTEFSGLAGFNACEVNLSAGGIRFALKPPVAVADLCLLLLRLPEDPRPLCLLAEVVWVAKLPVEAPLAGMQFLAISGADRKRLEQFIQRRGKAEADA